jgi:hypothetical protein
MESDAIDEPVTNTSVAIDTTNTISSEHMDVPPGFQDKEEVSQVHMEEYNDASKIYTAPLL